jgi:hypothetical protein
LSAHRFACVLYQVTARDVRRVRNVRQRLPEDTQLDRAGTVS